MHKTFILISIAMVSCGTEERSMNDTGIPIHVLMDSIENHGSVAALESLQIESLDYRAGHFLSTYMIMADKYNNANACMQVYYEITGMYQIPLIDDSYNGIYILDSLNPDARKMAIQYLEKADSLGDEEASAHLAEYKKLGLIE